LISALIRSSDHRVSKERMKVDEVELEDSSPDPEEHIIEAERVLVEGRLLDGLLRLADADAVAQKVLNHIFDGETRPRIIAERLGCSVDEVNNAKKRLDRMVDQLKKLASVSFEVGEVS